MVLQPSRLTLRKSLSTAPPVYWRRTTIRRVLASTMPSTPLFPTTTGATLYYEALAPSCIVQSVLGKAIGRSIRDWPKKIGTRVGMIVG